MIVSRDNKPCGGGGKTRNKTRAAADKRVGDGKKAKWAGFISPLLVKR